MWESMGKVQDTISRIARRHKPNATTPIALIVPSQQKPTKQSFPTSYTAVAKWLAAQSTAGQQTQIVGLTRALQHSNRLQNDAAERLKITTLFASQVNAVKPLLNQHFIGADLPYSSSAANAFESATTLLQELSYGYKIALVDVLLRRSNLHRLDRIHAIYFAMRSLAECGLRYSQSYLPWPDKYWRDINTLYWLAEKEKAIDETIGAATTRDNLFPTTIRTLYATIAMFHLSNNDHLPAHLMEPLLTRLSQQATLLPVTIELPETIDASVYSVAINSPNPPAAHRYCNYSAEDEIRYLRLQSICDSLLTTQVEESDSTPTLSRAQLQKILFIWSSNTKRRSARAVTHESVTIQTGLKDIYALYQQQSSPDHIAVTPRWTLVNRSNNGLCLRGNTRDHHQLQIGELITTTVTNTELGTDTLHTGVIRWIKCLQQDNLQIGIELIGSNVQPVLGEKITRQGRSYEPRLEALTCEIGTEGYTTTLLLLPHNQFRLGDTLKLYPSAISEISCDFKLIETINLDGRFDCFRINAVVSDKTRQTAAVI